jgi:hypothetical protein
MAGIIAVSTPSCAQTDHAVPIITRPVDGFGRIAFPGTLVDTKQTYYASCDLHIKARQNLLPSFTEPVPLP